MPMNLDASALESEEVEVYSKQCSNDSCKTPTSASHLDSTPFQVVWPCLEKDYPFLNDDSKQGELQPQIFDSLKAPTGLLFQPIDGTTVQIHDDSLAHHEWEKSVVQFLNSEIRFPSNLLQGKEK